MKRIRNIIMTAAVAVLLISATNSWGANPQNTIPQDSNAGLNPVDTVTIPAKQTGCTVNSIDVLGIGSYVCPEVDENDMNLNAQIEADASSNKRNFLVEATCGSSEKKFLVTSKHWKLIYSQLLAAQLSEQKVAFGPENSEPCFSSGVNIATSVKLLSK